MSKALLIDARNALYRAVYAGLANKHQVKPHFFIILLRHFTNLINIIRPTSVHVFWDAPRDTVWRRTVLQTYKERQTNQHVKDISIHLPLLTEIAKEFFDVMSIRQYSKSHMEADDLIYAAVTCIHPKQSVIVSTDSDMAQIPYRFTSNSVYHPSESKFLNIPPYNPAHLKALVGDETDVIKGYYGVGPVTGKALLANKEDLQEFLKSKGSAIYYRNLLLIDLSFCPRILANTVYVERQLAKPVKFSNDKINELIEKYKIYSLHTEQSNLVMPFKHFVDEQSG